MRNLDMTNVSTFRGERWMLEDQGHRLVVENAWSWSGTMQERIRLDGKVIFETTRLSLPVLWTDVVTCLWPPAGAPLTVQFKSGLLSVKARARVGGSTVRWSNYETGKWEGVHGEWPD
jgi:hypothetical protein